MFGKKLIVESFAVAGIANNRMLDMFHVLPDLMTPASLRRYTQQAVASRWIAINAIGQLYGSESLIRCLSRRSMWRSGVAIPGRIVNITGFIGIAADDGDIVLGR